MSNQYDIAAYIWPAYSDSPEMRWAFPDGMGEWERIIQNKPKFEGHRIPAKPKWGYVDEADPSVMEMQIDAACDHGVNVFIYDWYWYDQRPFLENCLNHGYLKARNCSKVPFFLMWANHHVNYTWDIRNSHNTDSILYNGCTKRSDFEAVCHHVIDKYLLHPSYYTIDEKPVFSIYELVNLVQGLGGVKETRNALEWFRKEVEKAGAKGLHLQTTLRGDRCNYSGVDSTGKLMGLKSIEEMGFDSVTHYQWCHFLNVDNTFSNLLEQAVEKYVEIEKTLSIPYFPHLSVGWDNNARFKALKPDMITQNDPAAFRQGLEKIKQYLDERPHLHPFVSINSWNEWTEGSYLQPDTEYGYGYLEAVKAVFHNQTPAGATSEVLSK